MSETALFATWSHFHLLMAGEKLDVCNFRVKNYGLSKQLIIEATILCHVDLVVKVMRSWNTATLVIEPPGQQTQYFHGVLMYDRGNLCNPPKDYLAYDIELETPFWSLTHTYTIASYHRTDIREFISHVIEASGLDKSRFNLGILPKEKKVLRYADQNRWFEFITKELVLAKVYSRSSFDKDNETILFSSFLPQFADNKNQPRVLSIRLAQHMTRDIPNLYFEPIKEYKQIGPKTYLNTIIKCFETLAYPGELIEIDNQQYFVENNQISGSHCYRTDAGKIVQDAEPTLISQLNLIPVEQGLELVVKAAPDRGFSVFTGQVEADIFGEKNVTRNNDGTYNARFDSDQQLDEYSLEDAPSTKASMRIEALQDLRLASIMGGYKHGVDLPLHDGTEVLFTKPNETDEPTLILGTLSNKKSDNLTTRANREENIIRTWSGNQLKFTDSHHTIAVALETPGAQNSLNFDYKSGAVKLSTKQGKIKLDAATDYIIHTPATIVLQTKANAKKLINKKAEQEAFEGTIRLDVKGNSYLTALDDYKIEVRKVIIESDKNIMLEAQNIIEINADELKIQTDAGNIEFSADIISINANRFVATTPGTSINIEDNILDLRSTNKAIIDIEQACHTSDSHNLGGKPEAPLKNEIKEIEKGKKEPALDPEQDESFEIEKSFTSKFEDKNACWENHNCYELSIDVSGKMKSKTKISLLGGLQHNQTLQNKLDDLVLEAVGNKSSMTLTKDGKLNLSTKVPSLENYEQSFEVGLDPKTKLPCASASISYEFYNYKLKTPHGELTLSGKAIFKNTFTPSVKPGVCEALVPSYRGMMEQRESSEFAAFSAAGAIALGGTGYFVGSKLAGLGASLIPAGMGAAALSPALAEIMGDNTKTKVGRKVNNNKTLIVAMRASLVSRGDEK